MSSSSSSSSTTTVDTMTSTEEASSTEPTPEDSCAAASADDCPAECSLVSVWHISNGVECQATLQLGCVAHSHAPESEIARTFYADGAFVTDGGFCGERLIPDGWAECHLGGVDQPPECDCFCQDGVCPGDEDRLELEACGVESLCAHAGNDAWPPFDRDDAVCVLTALRDRTPGFVEATYSNGFSSEHTRAYLDGSNEVTIVQELVEDFGGCPAGSWWNDAQRCTLTDPAVFDACMAGDDWAIGDCLKASTNWFESCRPAEPSCP
jgi:hypothetical protein